VLRRRNVRGGSELHRGYLSVARADVHDSVVSVPLQTPEL